MTDNDITPVEEIAFALRPGEPSDISFVYDTWLNSYRYVVDAPADEARRCKACHRMPPRDINGGGAVEGMRTGDYYTSQRRRIDAILAHGGRIVVAHPLAPANTPAVIAAWACVERSDILHYVYVREFYRRRGLATRLIGERRVCTHLTDSKRTDSRRGDSFAAIKEKLGIRYVPQLLDGK